MRALIKFLSHTHTIMEQDMKECRGSSVGMETVFKVLLIETKFTYRDTHLPKW